jgi:hypothetical protein
MLSESWESRREDKERRSNLFGDLSRIILAMTRIPHHRIAAWTINDRGVLSLTNRPLTGIMQLLENEGIPTDIPRDLTYSNVDEYYLDVLAYHDNRIKHQPNSLRDQEDGEAQLSFLMIMKALVRHFTKRDLHHGPFVMQLTDLHPSNIFVDENWRITKLIDLEWACARPIEMPLVPYWLTGQPLDGLHGKHLDAYMAVHEEFIQALEKEASSESDIHVTQIVRTTWESGGYWFFNALDAPDCLYGLFLFHIQQRFLNLESRRMGVAKMSAPFWTPNVERFIQQKIGEREKLHERLHVAFSQENGEWLQKAV